VRPYKSLRMASSVYWPRVYSGAIAFHLRKHFRTPSRADEYAIKVVTRFNRRYCGGGE
jgi:hypothetical protein